MSHDTALIGLAISLLGTLVVSTWRFAALATRLSSMLDHQREREKEQDARIKALDEIPAMRVELGHLTKNHSLIPRLESRIAVLEEKAQQSKEWRFRQSRPDTDDEG